MIPGECKENDWDLEDERNNSEESHERPHHSVLVQIEDLPDCREAPDEVKHDLEHIDFIEQERDAEG